MLQQQVPGDATAWTDAEQVLTVQVFFSDGDHVGVLVCLQWTDVDGREVCLPQHRRVFLLGHVAVSLIYSTIDISFMYLIFIHDNNFT